MELVRVLLADDDGDMRLLTKTLLDLDPRISVVAQAEDGVEAVAAFRAARPDVCVLDQRMPGLTGIDAAQTILTEAPDARIVIFSSFLMPADLTLFDGDPRVRCLGKESFTDLARVVVELG